MKQKASRAKARPWPSRSSFDILLEPVYKVSPAKDADRICPFEAALRSEYKRALDGNLPSQKKILKVMRANERARAKRDKRGARFVFEEEREPPCDYDAVLRLLAIAVRLVPPERYIIGKTGLRERDLYRSESDPSLKLRSWAFNVAVHRLGITDDQRLLALSRRVRVDGEELYEPVKIAPDPPRRDPKETRFQKGKSGNPKGRPRKPPPLEPLPLETFLNEEIAMGWDGKVRMVSRGEALLLTMMARAQQGYAGVSRVLIDIGADELVRRWERKEHHVHLVQRESADSLDTPLLSGLAELGIIKRRRHGFVMLEPWIVEEAVKRLEQELTEAEQIAVVRATAMPRKVNWPDWWLPHLREKAPPRPRKKKAGSDWSP